LAFGVAVAAVLWLLSKVLLIIFASILVAIALCGLAKPIEKYARVPHVLAVLVVALVVIALIGWPLTGFGSRLWAQFDEIAADIPKAISSIKAGLEAHQSVLFVEQVADIDFSKWAAPVATHITSIISTVGSAITYIVLLLFGGVYLALSPDFYIKGVIGYTPVNQRKDVQRFIEQSGSSLRTWLSTQLLVVVMNGLFAGAGLWAFGVDGAAALALLVGLLSFIPYVGTIIAMAIAALAALPQGGSFALYALVVIGVVSIIEGYFITPYVQSKALSLPPVILVFSIFAFALLFGTLGVILAAPLTVVLKVALDTFYRPEPVA